SCGCRLLLDRFGLGRLGRGVLFAALADDVEVELDLALLGALVDVLDVVLRVAGQLVVDARDQLRNRTHLAGADAPDRRRDRVEQAPDRRYPRQQLALDAGRVGLLEQQRLVEG